ncbi:MAG TPA: DNA polymerase IV [Alphaproteobacteria bacterium]|nr:DNA polymerase IV [Alphaproteobacteria bacterium]
MSALCRDCATLFPGDRRPRHCARCGSPRLVAHPELDRLAIAHIDCDAFYASIEKRDDPRLRDKPVLVGGGRRGVVAAACYVARTYGVRSAMPMFKALKLCPDAVVIAPDMRKYRVAGRAVRALMLETTPLVEPVSIDEAFLDLAGTERLHHGSAAQTLARLARRIEDEIRITVSIGLSYNKFLAKLASDFDKPRGFSVVGRAEAQALLAPKPASLIWGVGPALKRRLDADGIRTIGQLAAGDEREFVARYGSIGRRLVRFARGEDDRPVEPEGETKSISAETTFDEDLSALASLEAELWPACETVATRLKRAELAARTVTLKLKRADFQLLTRARTLAEPTQLAETLYRTGVELLRPETGAQRYRLIGIGASGLGPAAEADPPDLLDPGATRRAKVERAIDEVRAKLGADAIAKGRGFAPARSPAPKPKPKGKPRVP